MESDNLPEDESAISTVYAILKPPIEEEAEELLRIV